MSRGIVKRREGKDGFGLVSKFQNMFLSNFVFLPWNRSRFQGMVTVSCRHGGGHRMTCEQ